MKKILFVLAVLSATPAQASFNVRPVTTELRPPRHLWFCSADGYDYNGRSRSISGGLKPSKAEAARDALWRCHSIYSNCSVSSCFQQQ